VRADQPDGFRRPVAADYLLADPHATRFARPRMIQGQQGQAVVPEVGLDQSFTIGAAREQAGPPSQVPQTPPEVSL